MVRDVMFDMCRRRGQKLLTRIRVYDIGDWLGVGIHEIVGMDFDDDDEVI
jgi:hypothetical protein